MKKSLFLSAIIAICSFVSNPLFAVCPTQPDCASMGFTMSTTECSGATTIRCPFEPSNDNAVFCHKISGGSTCDTSVKDLIAMMGGNMQNVPYMFSSPGACSFSNKCYINSTITLNESSSCDSSIHVCVNGIGDNQAYFSFASAGCEVSSTTLIKTYNEDYKLGNNVYSEVPVYFDRGALMNGSVILKGDGNSFDFMKFYDNYSEVGSKYSGGYNGGAVVLAGNTTISSLMLETTKNVPLLVGDDSGKNVRLELHSIGASSTKGQLCIGLRPGGSVLVSGEVTEYNHVVSAKKEITSPNSGYYSSKPLVIATAEVCLGAAGGTTPDGETCATDSDYKWSFCDNGTMVCDSCSANGKYRVQGCRVQTNQSHELGGRLYCCDTSEYKYTSCPEAANCGTCGKYYNVINCQDSGWHFDSYYQKCCPTYGC